MSSILVVEDEARIASFVEKGLKSAGYAVTVAANGSDGFELARGGDFDLVLLDVGLPGMDGFEVLKSLRRDPEFMALPVIMLTAKAQDKDVFEGYHYGADMYLTKPFNPMELVAFVKRIAQQDEDTSGPKRYDL